MARKRPNITLDMRAILSDHLRRSIANDKREAMRQGVVQRAQTIPDKRKAANKKACRKGQW